MSKNGSLIASEILIVDDEEDIRDLISGILHDEGYATRVAGDSESALAAIRARRPQLVVLDIWLQGSRLDGIEVLDVVKREHPDVPVVMISGHGTIETAVASIRRAPMTSSRSRSRPTGCCMWWNARWNRPASSAKCRN